MSRGTNERNVHDRALNTGFESSFGGGECLGDHRPQRDNRFASVPSRRTFAEPSVSTISPSGTSIFDA